MFGCLKYLKILFCRPRNVIHCDNSDPKADNCADTLIIVAYGYSFGTLNAFVSGCIHLKEIVVKDHGIRFLNTSLNSGDAFTPERCLRTQYYKNK